MNIYEEAIKEYGDTSQIGMMVEEASELILALRHFDRGRNTFKNVCEEIADVEIMCAQMRIIFGNEIVEDCKSKKLKRLQKRLEF